MLPATNARVPMHTAEERNREIREQIRRNVERTAAEGPAAIDRRLAELDREWDIERTLETNAATLALTGSILAATVDRRWIALPMAVSAFLLQHALQGWCPPIPVIRRLGVRTAGEIAEERYALKALRGDFDDVCAERATSPGPNVEATRVLQAVRL